MSSPDNRLAGNTIKFYSHHLFQLSSADITLSAGSTEKKQIQESGVTKANYVLK